MHSRWFPRVINFGGKPYNRVLEIVKLNKSLLAKRNWPAIVGAGDIRGYLLIGLSTTLKMEVHGLADLTHDELLARARGADLELDRA